jgi:hypothetical protein
VLTLGAANGIVSPGITSDVFLSSVDPSGGACHSGNLFLNVSGAANHFLWGCIGGTYANLQGGGGGGVTSLNSLTGALTLAGTASQITMTTGGSTITASLPTTTQTQTWSSTATGATNAFATTNANFIVTGAGAVTANSTITSPALITGLSFASTATGINNAFATTSNNLVITGNGGLSTIGLIQVITVGPSNGGVQVVNNSPTLASAFLQNNSGAGASLFGTCMRIDGPACNQLSGNGQSNGPALALDALVSQSAGPGAPTGTCAAYARCIWWRSDGGAGTMVYSYYGGAWHAGL